MKVQHSSELILLIDSLSSKGAISKLKYSVTENEFKKFSNSVGKLNKLVNYVLKENTLKSNKTEVVNFTPIYDCKFVLELFKNNTNDNILQKYSANELKSMYVSIYGFKPKSNLSKKNIVLDIRNHIYSKRRSLALTN